MLATSRAAHRSRNGIPIVVAAQLVLQLVIGEGVRRIDVSTEDIGTVRERFGSDNAEKLLDVREYLFLLQCGNF